jgi:hypothetical protein
MSILWHDVNSRRAPHTVPQSIGIRLKGKLNHAMRGLSWETTSRPRPQTDWEAALAISHYDLSPSVGRFYDMNFVSSSVHLIVHNQPRTNHILETSLGCVMLRVRVPRIRDGSPPARTLGSKRSHGPGGYAVDLLDASATFHLR